MRIKPSTDGSTDGTTDGTTDGRPIFNTLIFVIAARYSRLDLKNTPIKTIFADKKKVNRDTKTKPVGAAKPRPQEHSKPVIDPRHLSFL